MQRLKRRLEERNVDKDAWMACNNGTRLRKFQQMW